MRLKTIPLCLGALALLAGAAPARAGERVNAPAFVSSYAEWSAQARATKRPRTRLRVHYGRLLYRDCAVRYVQEWRLSGAVIVPQMRCWWVRN